VDQQVFLPSSNCMHGRVQYSSNGSFATSTSTGPIRLFVIAGNCSGLHPRDIPIDNKWTDREYWTLLLPCLFGHQYRMCLPCVCLRSLLPSDSKGSLFPTTLVPNSFGRAQVGPTYVFCKVIIRRTKVSPPLSTFKASILPAKASEETSEKMEGLVSFQPFPSSVIQRRFSTVYLHRLTRSSSSSSCAPLRAQQSGITGGSESVSSALEGKVSEQEVVIYQDEVVASQGIRIRRRPPTGPPLHYVGPFEFRLQNEGNTPRNILEEIVWNKDKEVTLMKEKRPLYTLKKALETVPPPRDFIGALRSAHQRTGLPGLIAEVKKASPSRGILREDFDPVAIAQAYEKGGAACLSVLTDEKYFKGSFENLQAIREAGVKCPLLCKEFIIEAWQIYYGRSKGADAVLLIASVLPDLDIKYMIKICKILGMATLVEVHDEREMDRVLAIEGVELIGINNRNLEAFEVDIGITKRLLEGERGELIRQKDILVVGESGLFTPEDIAFVQEAGVKAVLVGESLVKQSDPGQGISALFGRDVSG
ncbi:unnamed protein product, partial [Brassica oleracea]